MTKIILLFFSFLVEAVIFWQYTSLLFIPKCSEKKKLIMLSLLYALLFLISLPGKLWLNASAFFLVNAFLLFTQCSLTVLSACFHSGILTAIMGTAELILYGVTLRFAPNFSVNTDSSFELIFYTVFSKLLFFAVIYAVAHIINKRNVKQDKQNKSTFFLMLIPVASIFIMLTFLTIIDTFSFISPLNFMVTVSAVFLLIVNLLVFGINQYNQKKSIEFTDMQLLLQKETDAVKYYEMLLSESENQSILIHDIKKHLQSIALLNDQKDYGKINAYIRQLMDSSDLKESSRICDNEMLNAILCRYQRQCKEKHIDFHADIRSGTLEHVYHHDLTSLFCNLLDNAVEAAENIPESFIEVNVHKKEQTPFTVIIVVNSCRSNPAADRNGIPFSTKSGKGRHGFGIKSIQKVVNQYNGNLQMYYDNATATFHTIITLKQ